MMLMMVMTGCWNACVHIHADQWWACWYIWRRGSQPVWNAADGRTSRVSFYHSSSEARRLSASHLCQGYVSLSLL